MTGRSMEPDELQEVLRPIASLISKSEKAQQKLAAGTWQHTMLQGNLEALRIAYSLMSESAAEVAAFTRDDLQQAVDALASMIDRVEGTRAKFAPGTSQHTLQRNRLNALRVAQAVTQTELDRR